MRSRFVLAAISLLAAPANAVTPHHTTVTNAPAKALPIFSFMGATTAAQAVPFKVGSKDCAPIATGETRCENDYSDVITIGRAQIVILLMNFNNGRLYNVEGEGPEMAFTELLSAFTTKYGSPSATETRKWENKAGGVFDNPTAIWHFKGGDLELSQMGSQRDDCAFSFMDKTNLPASAPPPVNF